MKKVELREDEQKKYTTIKKPVFRSSHHESLEVYKVVI